MAKETREAVTPIYQCGHGIAATRIQKGETFKVAAAFGACPACETVMRRVADSQAHIFGAIHSPLFTGIGSLGATEVEKDPDEIAKANLHSAREFVGKTEK